MSNVPTLFDSLGKLGQHKTIDLKLFRCPGLPEGYKLCAYVESNRDCYIDTGIASSDKVGIQMTYMYLGPTPTTSGEAIIGAGKSTDGTRQWINDASITSGSGLCVGWGGDSDLHGIPSQPGKIAFGQVNFMMSNTATVTIPEATATPTDLQLGYDAKFSSNTLYLFAANSGDGAKMYTHSRLYRCRISEGRQIKRDFVPVRRESDGKYGLFETVEKKVYFPEQGNLTGSELSSIWDYSHFNGVEGAYIDDYPTPDSPNFVKATGVEAGMAQIREALTVGPMLPLNNLTPTDVVDSKLSFFELLKNSTIPVPTTAIPNPKDASCFLYLPSFSGTGNGVSESFKSWKGPLKRESYYSYILGSRDSKYKSLYCRINYIVNNGDGAFNAIVPIQDNSNNLLSGVFPNHLGTGFIASVSPLNLTNISLRITGRGQLGLSVGGGEYRQLIVKFKNFNAFYYAPTTNATYYYTVKAFYGSGAGSLYLSPCKIKIYSPSYTYRASTSRTQLGAAQGHLDASSVIYALTYHRRTLTVSNAILSIYIDSQYFDTPVITTEEVASDTPTSDTYSTLTASTTKNDVTVTRTHVTADTSSTTGKLKTTTTWTLLPNTHTQFGEECRQLREALWNTNGIKHPTTGLPTSTGLLDGVIQVGKNAGTPYTNRWSLELHPVVHTWND